MCRACRSAKFLDSSPTFWTTCGNTAGKPGREPSSRGSRHLAEQSEPYSLGDLTIDYAGHRVALAGRPVRLTPTEYELLFELSVHAGRVLTHDRLLQRVWGLERTGEPWLVREVVKRLRRKLGDDRVSGHSVRTLTK